MMPPSGRLMSHTSSNSMQQGIKVQKVFEDGILYILRNGEKYDATGKRVSEK